MIGKFITNGGSAIDLLSQSALIACNNIRLFCLNSQRITCVAYFEV